MTAIFKRELKAYFSSMLGYVFLTILLLLTGTMFFLYNLTQKSGSMTNFFAGTISWVIFILPILTMRLFSEDRKSKTEQLLLTAPVSLWEIVLGKFLAAFCVFLIGTAITALYPIILSFYGKIPLAETISVYVGFILFCGIIISIGAFMSSLTESQIVAAVATYGVVVVMVFLNIIAGNISNPTIAAILTWISPTARFSDFTMGVLNLEPILYYISMIGIFLFLTVRVFEKRRWS
jgi:ABC-2 type transport system permease protein